jgi:hypothetical protein
MVADRTTLQPNIMAELEVGFPEFAELGAEEAIVHHRSPNILWYNGEMKDVITALPLRKFWSVAGARRNKAEVSLSHIHQPITLDALALVHCSSQRRLSLYPSNNCNALNYNYVDY